MNKKPTSPKNNHFLLGISSSFIVIALLFLAPSTFLAQSSNSTSETNLSTQNSTSDISLSPESIANSNSTIEDASKSSSQAPASNLPDESSLSTSLNNSELPNSIESNLPPQDFPLGIQNTGAPTYTEIDAESVIVYSFNDLKSALSNDNGYINYYLGGNITGEIGGIIINPHKPSIVLDGHPPGTADGLNYTYTEYVSTALSDTIRVENNTTKSVSIKNINIVGGNYYGTISIPEIYQGVVQYYENIVYHGPQITFNRSGSAHYSNADITITMQEVAEAENIVLSNKVTINNTVPENIVSTFWMTSTTPELTIEDQAVVSITANQGSHYIVFNNEGPTVVTVGKDANFTANTSIGFTYYGHYLASVTLDTGARFSVQQSNDSSNGVLHISKALTVQENAVLDLRAYGISSPAVRFPYGGSTVQFNNPQYVLLYSTNNKPLHFDGSNNTFTSHSSSISRWVTSATPDHWNQLPNTSNFNWSMADTTAKVDLSIKYTGDTANTFTTNHTAAEETTGGPLTIANFSASNSRMLVFSSILAIPGSISGTVFNDITGSHTPGGGNTPRSGVAITAYATGTNTLLGSTVSAANGSYIFNNLSKSQGVDVVFTNPVTDDSLRFTLPTSEPGHQTAKASNILPSAQGSNAIHAGLSAPLTTQFNGNKGTPSLTSLIRFPNETILSPPAVSLSGHTLDGWYTASSGGTKVDFPHTITASTTLYARWVPNSHTIVFYAGTGTGSMPAQTVSFGQATTLNNNLFTKPGYKFNGWATLLGGQPVYNNNASFTLTQDNSVSLYATWIIDPSVFYTAYFNTGAGQPTPAEQNLNVGQFIKRPVNVTLPGYRIENWYETEDFSGSPWNFETDTMPAQPITLYANWVVDIGQTFEAAFIANGGIPAPSEQRLNTNALLEPPATITRTGYSFNGWYQTPNFTGTSWDFATNTMPAQPITLYAMWVPNIHNIQFNGGGGTGNMNSLPATFGLPTTLPANTFTKTGYQFTGWALEEGKNPVLPDAANFTLEKDQDITLYASWKIDTGVSFTVDFVPGNGLPVPPQQTLTVNTLVIEPLGLPEQRPNYEMLGWYLTDSFTGQPWNFATDTMPANNITLYAKWQLDTEYLFSITFVPNNGTPAPEKQALKLDNLITQPAPLEQTGYQFEGWYRTSDFSDTKWNFTTDRIPAQDIILYAKWVVDTNQSFTATFHTNGGTPAPPPQTKVTQQTLEDPGLIAKTGYLLEGWYLTPDLKHDAWSFATHTMPAHSIHLYAKWVVDPSQTFEVSFIPNGGSPSPPSQNLTVEAPIPMPTNLLNPGYKLQGWYSNEDFTGTPWNFTTDTMPANGITLYAKWVIDPSQTFTVLFLPAGGTPAPTPQYNNIESLLIQPAAISRPGFTFDAWYLDPDDTSTPWNFATQPMPGHSIALYANWVPNTYQINFNANGGSGSMQNQSVPFGGSALLTNNSYTKLGYTFSGWSTSASGPVTYLNQANYTYTQTNNITLYAKWVVDTTVLFDVTFEENQGQPKPDTQSIHAEAFVDPPSAISRIGYTFGGWYLNETFTGLPWNFTSNTMPAKNITLYGKWVPNPYIVKFAPNGGTGNMEDLTIPYHKSTPLPKQKFTRAGFTFMGWATSSTGAVSYGDRASFTQNYTNTVVLYAVWQVKNYQIQFNPNGGVGANMGTLTTAYNKTLPLPANTYTKNGYRFTGWADTPGGKANYSEGALFTLNKEKNYTLYATWAVDKNTFFTVHFATNTGGLSVAPQLLNAESLLAKPNISRNGYSLDGWYKTPDFSGNPWDFSTEIMPPRTITLYARWVSTSSGGNSSSSQSEDRSLSHTGISTLPQSASSSPAQVNPPPAPVQVASTRSSSKAGYTTESTSRPASGISSATSSKKTGSSSALSSNTTGSTPSASTTTSNNPSYKESKISSRLFLGLFPWYGSGATLKWSLFNLVLSALAILTGTICFSKELVFRHRKSHNNLYLTTKPTIIVSILALLIPFITLIFSHFTHSMVLFDDCSIILTLLFAIQLYLVKRMKNSLKKARIPLV